MEKERYEPGGLAHRDTVQEPARCLESSALLIAKTGVPWSRRDLVAMKGARVISIVLCSRRYKLSFLSGESL